MKIALVCGPFTINKYFAELTSHHQLVAFVSGRWYYNHGDLAIPTQKLHCWELLGSRIPKFHGMYRTIFGWNYQMSGLEQALRDFDVAIVHDMIYAYSYQAMRARRMHGLKVIYTVAENIPFNYETSLTRAAREEMRQKATHFIAVSERSRTALLVEGIEPQRVSVVHQAIDSRPFCRSDGCSVTRHQLGLQERDFVILFVGRLIWYKGVFDLVYAFKLLVMENPQSNLKLLFVGDGPDRHSLESVVERLGVRDQTRFVAYIPYDQMPNVYRAANLCVLPSIPSRHWQEQSGYAIKEAMASGTPVVTTMSGAIPETVADCAILVQPNDPKSLFDAMSTILREPRLGDDLAARAQRRVREDLDVEVLGCRLLHLLERVI